MRLRRQRGRTDLLIWPLMIFILSPFLSLYYYAFSSPPPLPPAPTHLHCTVSLCNSGWPPITVLLPYSPWRQSSPITYLIVFLKSWDPAVVCLSSHPTAALTHSLGRLKRRRPPREVWGRWQFSLQDDGRSLWCLEVSLWETETRKVRDKDPEKQ